MIKGKISQNDEVNKAQAQQIEACATKTELSAAAARAAEQLAAAIKRSDEMLEFMRKRAEEDRASGEGHYRELYGIITSQGERITAVETTQKAIDKILAEIKSDIKTGFSEVKSELKELRKQ
jgi:CRP-like cAMP-binding protein